MKRIIACLLIFSLIIVPPYSMSSSAETAKLPETAISVSASLSGIDFSGLSDPDLLRYIEDNVYSTLIENLDSDDFFVENVSAIYISKEYLDEMAYNSKANIYFGYTLSELSDQFQGTKYVFTLGEDGQTVVQDFQSYDDTFDKVIRNVAIGAGVVLLCVTVSIVTGGTASAISVIFAASAKTATTFALSCGVLSGVAAGIAKGIQTEDFDESLKAAALAGSESFMWGALTGAITGGAQSAIALKGATLNGLTLNEVATIQRESKYPLDVIKQFKTVEQYNICKNAGLVPVTINEKTALVRSIDLNYVDEWERSNLQRMKQGLAALDPTGNAYELHHIGQKVDSTLAILTKQEHMKGGNDIIWHNIDIATDVHRAGNTWNITRIEFWKTMAKLFGGI